MDFKEIFEKSIFVGLGVPCDLTWNYKYGMGKWPPVHYNDGTYRTLSMFLLTVLTRVAYKTLSEDQVRQGLPYQIIK